MKILIKSLKCSNLHNHQPWDNAHEGNIINSLNAKLKKHKEFHHQKQNLNNEK
jgi:hypothetical protein